MDSRAAPTGQEFDSPALHDGPFTGIDHVQRGGVWFSRGVVTLHLGVDADFHPAKKAHPAFRCADYMEYLERLRSRGVTIIIDDNPLEGKAHCYVADPFGNRIELIAN